MPSLYRHILGPKFDVLPTVLREFHDAPSGGRAHATFHIVRPPGIFRYIMGMVLGLPKSGTNVPVRLQIVIDGDRERWVREFQDRRLESIQWTRGELLMEQFGPVVFSCTLIVDGLFLRYKFQNAWFAGVRIPRALSPFVESYVKFDNRRWWTMVRVFAPLLGEIVRYEGWVEPE